MPRQPRWTDRDLTAAVTRSETLAGVCRELGISGGKKTYERLREHIRRLDLDDHHLLMVGRRSGAHLRRWTDDELRSAVAESVTMAQVQRRLGFAVSGGSHRALRGHIERLNLETTHFTGRSWSRGLRVDASRRTRELQEILVVGSSYNSGRLRERLIAAGMKTAECEMCGLSRWRGQQIVLELDHVNGVHTDNRIENLRILCPNCHSLTETWCRAKRQVLGTNAEL